MRIVLILTTVILFAALGREAAHAQSQQRIWNIEFGTPVAALPHDEWVEPACGTNGGPPSLVLNGFTDFARCPIEPATGLREVWFIYEDEWQYIAQALRDADRVWLDNANKLGNQLIITSLLIDDEGLVQGYRVVTDPRTPSAFRIEAGLLAPILMSMVGGSVSWACTDLPRGERETPIEGAFIKQSCEKVTDDILARLEARHLHKPGQDLGLNPRMLDQAEGDFESSARLEVYNARAVMGSPCCPEAGRP